MNVSISKEVEVEVEVDVNLVEEINDLSVYHFTKTFKEIVENINEVDFSVIKSELGSSEIETLKGILNS